MKTTPTSIRAEQQSAMAARLLEAKRNKRSKHSGPEIAQALKVAPRTVEKLFCPISSEHPGGEVRYERKILEKAASWLGISVQEMLSESHVPVVKVHARARD